MVCDLLSFRQRERLIEANLLYLLSRLGINWFLFQTGIQTTLGFDDQVAREVLEDLLRFRDDLSKQRNRLVESTHDELLTVREKSQKEASQETLLILLQPTNAAGSAASQFGRLIHSHFKPLGTSDDQPVPSLSYLPVN
jgi:hypothetical protein